MATFNSLRLGPSTELIRDKNGELSLIYNERQFAINDDIPPEVLAYVTACVTRDYGDMRHWPEMARQFVRPREVIEGTSLNRASPA
jgi:hypothetical protein